MPAENSQNAAVIPEVAVIINLTKTKLNELTKKDLITYMVTLQSYTKSKEKELKDATQNGAAHRPEVNIERIVQTATEAATKAAVQAVEDLFEKKEKKLNLVIVGLPEKEDSDMDQNAVDLSLVHSVCEEFEIPVDAVSTTFRDGMRARLPGGRKKNRIMKVCFESGQHRQTFLRNATTFLRRPDKFGREFFKPFVRKDMSFLERQQDRALREELKARKASGEANIFIRNGEIVHRTYATVAQGGGAGWRRRSDEAAHPRVNVNDESEENE